MFVIFGWEKEARPVRPVLEAYCYHCQKEAIWHLWRETEWVSFFFIRTVPFLWKHFLVCSGCSDAVALEGARYRRIVLGETGDDIFDFLEEHQMAEKNETQRSFLRAIRASRQDR